MERIICIGNRYVDEDSAGPRVFDELRRRRLPEGVELVDGGLAGLDLLRWVEGCERVVFVDTVSGFGAPGDVLLIDAPDQAFEQPAHLDHDAGFEYLLAMAPLVVDGPAFEMVMVGLEPPTSKASVRRAAEMSLLAVGGTVKEARDGAVGGVRDRVG